MEEVDQQRQEDEDDDQIIDIMTAPRTVLEDTYSLPVIMDQEWEVPDDISNAPVVNGVVRVNATKPPSKKR